MSTSQHTTRIIAGDYQYRVLKQPGGGTRPVTQKIRAAIFNALGHDLEGLTVLDLYAGSGALGIEALSRGAKSLVSVERLHSASVVLKENFASVGLDETRAQLMERDAADFTSTCDETFDIIFLDPPYADFQEEVANRAAKLLSSDGVLVVSTAKRTDLPEAFGPAKQLKTKVYGETQIAYFKN